VNVTALPTTNGLGEDVKLVVKASALIVTVADVVAVTALPSVTVTDTVLLPFTEYVVEKLAPVPLAGLPPVAVQLNT